MYRRDTDTELRHVLCALERQARAEHAISEAAAAAAAATTRRRLGGTVDAGTERGRRRVAAYFWGVVRRGALAGEPGLGTYRARMLAATFAADLAEAGHAPESIAEALVSRHGAHAALSVLGAGGLRTAVVGPEPF